MLYAPFESIYVLNFKRFAITRLAEILNLLTLVNGCGVLKFESLHPQASGEGCWRTCSFQLLHRGVADGGEPAREQTLFIFHAHALALGARLLTETTAAASSDYGHVRSQVTVAAALKFEHCRRSEVSVWFRNSWTPKYASMSRVRREPGDTLPSFGFLEYRVDVASSATVRPARSPAFSPHHRAN